MANSVKARAEEVLRKLAAYEVADQAGYDYLTKIWNISFPLIKLIASGYVERLTYDGQNALTEFEDELERLGVR